MSRYHRHLARTRRIQRNRRTLRRTREALAWSARTSCHACSGTGWMAGRLVAPDGVVSPVRSRFGAHVVDVPPIDLLAPIPDDLTMAACHVEAGTTCEHGWTFMGSLRCGSCGGTGVQR